MRERPIQKWICVTCLILFFVPALNASTFKIKLVALDTQIAVGEETTLQIWGWANDPAAVGTNGIKGWDMSLDIPSNQNGILQVKPNPSNPAKPLITHVNPSPFDSYTLNFTGVTFNTPQSGDINMLGAVTTATTSTTGISGYSLLANVTLQGLSLGTATYSVSGLVDTFLMDETFINSWSLDPASVNTITVIPEPVSCLLFLLGSGLILRGRK